MESGRLVIDGSIEVRAFRSHSWPSGRTQTPKDRFGDNVGGVIRTDKTRGEARQIFSMLPVQLGISNIDEAGLEQLHRLARIKPAVVQNRFHAETGYDRELRSFCRHHEVIYQSFWTLTANPQALVQPAIVEAADSTTLLPPDWSLRCDRIGNLFATRSG